MTERTKQILTDPNTVLVFDIDGTLARYEFGSQNHNACPDAEWKDYLAENRPYETAVPVTLFQQVIQKKPDQIFICSVVSGMDEVKQKEDFIKKNFPEIPATNIYFVGTEEDKLISLYVIQSIFDDKSPKDIFMIDDSCSVLNHIQEHSQYGTIHISSFLE